MKRSIFYSITKLLIFLAIILVSSCSSPKHNDFSERTKIALRDVGHKLLLSNQDSTSLILPVLEIETNGYQLSFSESLSFEPSSLVSEMRKSLMASELPNDYRVEVLQCENREVAYSYQMSDVAEYVVTPCAGRYLPENCYLIELKFINRAEATSIKDVIITTILVLVFALIVFLLIRKLKRIKAKKLKQDNGTSKKLGNFYFYPEQNKLVKEAVEIALSKKECELLALFVASPNQIIKRDELTKRVWEDNGVFVGRSLDTYISKLRKKLKSDTTIKLTNVHGVGYKLEID